jgi:very-short-patch-repair endonuclease
MYKKRYNVAVSRAKNQLWVVHSLNPNMDLKPDDIRHRLINHVRNFKMEEKVIGRAESPFEKEVITALLSKGYKVIPQLIVGSYRLDMVVISGTKKIAIECDGERYHTPDNLEDDMNRQAILERCGWRFIRIRGSKYYSNKSGTLKELFEELEQKEIYPVMSDEANLNEVSDTASEVKRVAASILNNKTIDFLEEKIEEIYTDDPHSKPNTINPASPDEVENGPINKPLSTEKVQRPLFDFTKMN